MALRPQDVLIALKLALEPKLSYPLLATELGVSLSEAHAAVRRGMAAGLLDSERAPRRAALLEFLVHGVKYAFPPKRGSITRGLVTAHAGPPLVALLDAGTEPPPVWPDAEGKTRGESFEPLYRSVPIAARRDPKLYELLCLLDAIRGGRARDRVLAEKLLRERLAA
jgi:hypothetical protein